MKFLNIWIAQLLIATILGGGIFLIFRVNQRLLDDVYQHELQLHHMPQARLGDSILQAEISKEESRINDIKNYLVHRNDLIDLISEIEIMAAERGVEVRVPNISERDFSNEDMDENGLMQDLVMNVVVQGNQRDILGFLHALEHAPYLLRLESWRVGERTQPVSSLEVSSLSPEENEPVQSATNGEARVIVTVWRGNGGAR